MLTTVCSRISAILLCVTVAFGVSALAAEDGKEADSGVVTFDMDNARYMRERVIEQRSILRTGLRDYDLERICGGLRQILGEQPRDDFWALDVSEVLPALRAELKRRRINVDERRVRDASIRIGDGQCQLFASLGRPIRVNRTVTAGGVRLQLIYESGLIVYTRNGIVDAFQD